MKTMQKVIVLLLVLAMAVSCLPMGVLATETEEIPQVELIPEETAPEEVAVPEETEEEEEEAETLLLSANDESNARIIKSGTCGDNLTWTLDSNGLLSITGEGKMEDFIYSGGTWYPTYAPWRVEDKVLKVKNIKKIVISSGVTYIGDYAFCELPNVTSVSIPNTVQAFGVGVFCGDKKLSSVSIPDGVTEIPKSMFRGCASLKKISIPVSVNQIGSSAFETCGFTSITLPKGITRIEASTFQYSSLTSIVIPEGVTEIGSNAFDFSTNLKSITLPNSLTTIHLRAFQDTAITTIAIPKNVTYIGNNAFSCSKLKTIYFTGDAPDMDPHVFEETTAIAYYPKSNPTWTTDVLKDYTGNITWVAQTPLVIAKQPESVTVKHGETAAVTVIAEGNGLTYAWYFAKKGNTKFSKSSIKSNTYSTIMDLGKDGRQVYCVITDENGKTAKTDTVTLNMEKVPLAIAKQPESVTVKYGEKAQVSVEAQGDGLTYAWYYAKAGATKFSKSSTSTNTYSATMDASRDGRQVYCVITDVYGKTAKTETVTLNMEKVPLVITQQPESVTVKYGETAQVSVEAKGDGLTYAWYYAKAGATKFSKSSTTKNTYSATMDASRDGRQVYCVITDVYGKTVKTETVTLNMEKVPLVITKQPENVSTKYGEKVSVAVEAEGDGLTYTWYFAKKGSTKFSKSSITKNTYSTTMDSAKDGRKIYCVVKDAYGKTLKTEVVTLTLVRVPFAITKQPESVRVKYGETASVTVEAEGDGLTYTWYFAKKGSTKFSKSSTTKNTYSVKMSQSNNGRKVYCVVKDAYGKTKKTETVTLNYEKTPLKIVRQPEVACLAVGESHDITLIAEGDGLTYQWYYTKDPAKYTQYSKSSVTRSVYPVTMTADKDGRRLYCIVKDAYGNSVKSDVVWIYIDW